jgi:5-methylcytosine-specific restriction endonuclease McrA
MHWALVSLPRVQSTARWNPWATIISCMHVPPPADDYPEVLERALLALASGDTSGAHNELAPIAYETTTITKARGMKRAVQGRVFRRDRFQCRYCGARVIPIPIMELLGDTFGPRFPYHPNWKGGETHPAVLSRTAVIDHVSPAAWGGSTQDENLATACWPCNARKADMSLERLGWSLLPIAREAGWDGLVRFYPHLWRRAGYPKPKLHREWAQALGAEID